MGFLFAYFPSTETLFGPSPIDWCEANYVSDVSGFRVAELHNTWTNAAYVIASLFLLLNKSRSSGNLMSLNSSEGGIFLFYCIAFFMTGVTSGIFHATLVWLAQKADEIFENWAVLVLFHITFTSISTKSLFRRIKIHAILCALGMIMIPVIFCEVHLIIMCFATVYRFQLMGLDHIEKIHLGKTAIFAASGFGCWLCDFFACSTFSAFYLHAFGWHILTALALYEAGMLLHSNLLKRVQKSGKA
jgi:hypothetical protein